MKINKQALAQYLRFGYVPPPFSIKENSTQNPIAEFTPTNNVQKFKSESIVDCIEQELLATIGMIGEMIDYGVLISGGVDSSLMATLASKVRGKKLKTFSLSFLDYPEVDESKYSRQLADFLKTDHFEFEMKNKDVEKFLLRSIEYMIEPFGDSSIVPTFAVCEFTSKEISAALVGDGGDEFFGGYDRHKAIATVNDHPIVWHLLSKFQSFPFLGKGLRRDRIKQLLEHPNEAKKVYDAIIGHFSRDEVERLTGVQPELTFYDSCWRSYKEMPLYERMMKIDQLTYLPFCGAIKTYYASYPHHLKTFAPILDQQVMNLNPYLPIQMKTRKKALKQMLQKYQVPSSIYDRPKHGFGVPIDSWLNDCLRPIAQDTIISTDLDEYIDTKERMDLIERYYSKEETNLRYKIWDLMIFGLWIKEHDENS